MLDEIFSRKLFVRFEFGLRHWALYDKDRPNGPPGKPAATPPPSPSGTQDKVLPVPHGKNAIEYALAEGNMQVTMDKVEDNGNITHSAAPK